MVTTGARAGRLMALLQSGGLRAAEEQIPAPRMEQLSADLRSGVLATYRALGGSSQSPTLRPGRWDLQFDGGIVVELDEELHFNRYRAVTLAASWSDSLPWQRSYLSYCATREAECLRAGRWGKRWSNPSCERLFGAPDAPGEFTGGGAPRWKQRALYDSIKDAHALSNRGVRLARISIHDLCGGITIGSILESTRAFDSDQLIELLRSRLSPT